MSVIIGNSNGSQIGEQSQKDDKIGSDCLVDDTHRSDQVDFQVQAESDTVLHVGLHSLENLTGTLDGVDDGGETGSKEDDIGSSLSGLGGTLDSNTAVRFL